MKMILKCLLAMVALAGSAVLPVKPAASQTDAVNGNLIQFNNNGGWSWFEDERSIVDTQAGNLLVSSVADSSGALGRSGDVDVAIFSLATGRARRFTLNGTMVADDHNSAALLRMNDGRYLAAYSNHNSDKLTHSRTTVSAGDASMWNPEVTRSNSGNATYNNLFQLPAESNRIYNFTRTAGFDPNILYSDDNGVSWQAGGKLIDGGGAAIRPYVKYTSNDRDTIHFINTEQHPRNFDNSVYHSFTRGGKVFDSTGTKIGNLGTGISSTAGTKIFDGNSENVGWVSDLHLDEAGNPFVAFTVQKDSLGQARGDADAGQDHRYHFARFDGSKWHSYEIAFAGTRLYPGEDDYTGNIALNPNNPNEVFISTNVDPISGAPLISFADGIRHWEIFKGITTDRGKSWNWSPITENSTVDNLRPIVPVWDAENRALLWMRGEYSSYKDYDLAVVGLVQQAGVDNGPIAYVDADRSNTTRKDGKPWSPTTGAGRGATDDRWHLRTDFGNNGSVLTVDEKGAESAAMLQTTLTNKNGKSEFDIFVFFWSNKFEDWEIVAGLDPDELVFFRKQAGQHADSSNFTAPVLVDTANGNEYMYQVYLGRVTLDQGEHLTVFLDGAAGGSTERTWYDGVGLSRITSAPGHE